MFCADCFRWLSDTTVFCPTCGKKATKKTIEEIADQIMQVEEKTDDSEFRSRVPEPKSLSEYPDFTIELERLQYRFRISSQSQPVSDGEIKVVPALPIQTHTEEVPTKASKPAQEDVVTKPESASSSETTSDIIMRDYYKKMPERFATAPTGKYAPKLPRKYKQNSGHIFPDNICAVCSYLGFFFTGIMFFILKEDRRFVCFHAAQSIVLFMTVAAILIVLKIMSIATLIPFYGFFIFYVLNFLTFIVLIIAFIFWIALMVLSYYGISLILPIISDWAENLVKRFSCW